MTNIPVQYVEALQAVRATGRVNMLDRSSVCSILLQLSEAFNDASYLEAAEFFQGRGGMERSVAVLRKV